MLELDEWNAVLASLALALGALGVVSVLAGQAHGLGLLAELRLRRRCALAFTLARKMGDAQLRQYAQELGYAALVGGRHLSHEQRAFLLSIPDADRAIRRYLDVQHLLIPCVAERRFIWRYARHEHAAYRSVVRIARLSCGMAACMLAILPGLTWTLVHGAWLAPPPLRALQLGYALVFLLLAAASLRRRQQLEQAQALVASGSRARGGALEALYPIDIAFVHRTVAANE